MIYPENVKEYEYTVKDVSLAEGLAAIPIICLLGVLYVKLPEVAIPLTGFLADHVGKYGVQYAG